MEHPRIDDEHIIDRYLAARLGPEEEALFEEHLFACDGCLEKVQWGEELRRGLRAVAVEEAARASVAVGLMAWLRSRRPGQLAGLAGLALAFVLLPALLLWQQGELSRLRRAGGQIAAGSAGFAGPVSDFLVISLGVVRDAGDAVEIRPEPGKEAVLLSLELPVVTFPRYRITLRNTAGKVLWQGEDLEPNLYDTLLVALPSSYLAPGSYQITVEAPSAAGAEPVGEMAFRVLAQE